MNFSLDISGVAEIKKAIADVNTKVTDGLNDELKASALNIQKAAKRAAPANLGGLRGSIGVSSEYLSSNVFSTVSYAPYVEFGTGGKVSIPSGFDEFAAQYKGKKGGKWVEFLAAIKQWVKRKGIDEKLAYVIARSILRNGIRPQPFMIPSYQDEKPKLIKRLQRLFK